MLLESCNLHIELDCSVGTFLGANVKTVVLFFEEGRLKFAPKFFPYLTEASS